MFSQSAGSSRQHNMGMDEPQIIAISIAPKQQVGHLKPESTWVHCPACERSEWSVVQLEAVTCFQRFLGFANLCNKWPGRTDINHYCSQCGCFIGRFVAISCMERCISKSAKRKAAVDDMTLKTRPKDCAERAQKSREKVLAKRAENSRERILADRVKKQAEKDADETHARLQSRGQTQIQTQTVVVTVPAGQ
ncbi:uncharacterized protein [Drosophila pseudoobscura]|uniref:LITAF domain-containing protein n=1 Tax=Drosophila pseudoobscura pseudoobscura TaxID=46245 RepID=A0A6I8UT28_DROPS|nr:uncharacterized protein LOC4803825 [Drosophila pseudoobscura]